MGDNDQEWSEPPAKNRRSSGDSRGWWDLLARWLFSQGVSTVLLFAIGMGVWYGLPATLASIQSGYEKAEKSQDVRYETLREHNEAMLKYVIDNCCDSGPRVSSSGGKLGVRAVP